LPISAGDVNGRFDTTLSYGTRWRVSDRDNALLGATSVPHTGSAFSVNGDDGNQNYDQGLVSNTLKITSDLELNYQQIGIFLRGSAFYDYENKEGQRAKAPLSSSAQDLVGSDAYLLDAYIWGSFNLGDMPLELRLGDQVVNWGESTFIQNGINAINPFDLGKLRVPGAELREGLVPVGLLWGSLGITDNKTLEFFYQYDWDKTVADAPGSYFSSNDFAGEGGRIVKLGFGASADTTDFLAVPRTETRHAKDSGQYGLAFRWYAKQFHDTEFGFYYMNYHSRLPLISARTGTLASALAAKSAAAAVYKNAGVAPGTSPRVDATARAVGTDTYSQTAAYFTSYPEDIKLFGISFNTSVNNTALQGEYSYRRDVPLQLDDIAVLFAALGPINPALASLNQIGNFQGQFETDVIGYRRHNVSQLQLTATHVFGPTMGASTWVMLGEAAVSHVHSLPNKNTLRYDGPGTYVTGNATLSPFQSGAVGELEEDKHFADATSWGYRLASKLVYNNAFKGINLSPRLAWQHDVSGVSPGPAGNFIQGRKAITIGLGANYQNSWSADVSYTNYFGAGRYNLINDRDFVAFNLKYAF